MENKEETLNDYYKNINQITWLLEAIKEKFKFLNRTAAPLYRYLDIVLSNEFCIAEATWNKSKMIVNGMTSKYSYLLKRGMLNINVIRRNISNYALRFEILSIDGYRALNDFYRIKRGNVPYPYAEVLAIQKDLVKLAKSLRSNPILNIVTDK